MLLPCLKGQTLSLRSVTEAGWCSKPSERPIRVIDAKAGGDLMKISRWSRIAILLAALGQPLVYGSILLADTDMLRPPQPSHAAPPVTDVSLSDQNRLTGTIVDRGGIPLVGASVTV